jgi:hypothetical protein
MMHILKVLFRQSYSVDLLSSCEFTKNGFPIVSKKR